MLTIETCAVCGGTHLAADSGGEHPRRKFCRSCLEWMVPRIEKWVQGEFLAQEKNGDKE